MRVSESVRAVQVPDDSPMHPVFTTIYIVGGDQVMTIDSGEAIDRYRWMLRGYLAAAERAEIALAALTHHHFDHSGNLRWIRENLGAEVLIPPGSEPLLTEQLPRDGYSSLNEGRMLDLGSGIGVQINATPGHSPDSICYYLESEGVLFTGDTLLGNSTTTVRDLGQYMDSLRRLLILPNLKVICPGHGELVHDPRERLQSYIDHRDERERQILAVLAEGGEITSWEIMLRIYTEIDPRLRRAADGNVRTHLDKLEREGRLRVEPGVPKQRSDEELRRAEDEARQRAEDRAKAEQAAAEARRAALRAQENPPLEEWESPPKYELVGTSA
jgi:glyoxylase-like metal-dependent hydrolase (beta-lactamase superfamily II)